MKRADHKAGITAVSQIKIAAVLFFLSVSAFSFCQGKSGPIIDMHIHANHANFAGMVPKTLCIFNEEYPAVSTGTHWGDTLIAAALVSEITDEKVRETTFQLFRNYNMFGVTSGKLTEERYKAEPETAPLLSIKQKEKFSITVRPAS